MFHMREYYVQKYQSHDTDAPKYMEALSVEHPYEWYKATDGEIQSLIRRDTWEIVSSNSDSDKMCLKERGF